tara:strand:- start:1 stop:210 length:210 start_codon:yes stop_codon:yes gene_type:complete
MDGYGLYVWSAFAFTFLICLILFLKTRRSLKKLESEFKIEANNLSKEKLEILKEKKIAQEILGSRQKTS